jgi:thioredoxin 1
MIKIYDFYADWCNPCKQLAPILEEIEATFDWVDIVKIDISEDDEGLAQSYNIRNIPTLLFFKEGKLVDKVVGMTSKSNLLDILNKHS